MKKYFLIPQPPITEKFTFLVDDISEKKNWGLTEDIDKIEYNRKLLGENFNVDLKVNLLMSEKDVTNIFTLGNFITVLEMREDQKEGRMTFFDCVMDMPKDELKYMIGEVFSKNIVEEWIKFYDLLNLDFSEENDIVDLFKPEEVGFNLP